ncbi:MAG: MarR family transcriptional regulator [Clostridia bacterium]|nr:MarR family transcriptional regulator [Clostridia bacterium]
MRTDVLNDPLCLDDQLCFPLYACAKEVIRQYRKPLTPLGLTYTQYIVMMVLWESGGMTEGELGKRVHLDSGTLAPLLKRLDKQGLIRPERPDHDERTLLVSLTEMGAALREKAETIPGAMRGCIPLPEDDLLALRSLLKRALAGMNKRKQEE